MNESETVAALNAMILNVDPTAIIDLQVDCRICGKKDVMGLSRAPDGTPRVEFCYRCLIDAMNYAQVAKHMAGAERGGAHGR